MVMKAHRRPRRTALWHLAILAATIGVVLLILGYTLRVAATGSRAQATLALGVAIALPCILLALVVWRRSLAVLRLALLGCSGGLWYMANGALILAGMERLPANMLSAVVSLPVMLMAAFAVGLPRP